MKIQTKPSEYGSKIAPDEIMANMRAKQYRNKIKRRREMVSTAIRHAYLTFVALFMVGLFAYGFHTGHFQIPKWDKEVVSTETETTTKDYFEEMDFSTEITTPTEIALGIEYYDGYYYVFCEVAECNGDTFIAILPTDGSYQEFYMIADPPVDDFGNPEFTICVFKVAEEDFYANNYDAWVVINAN